MQVICCLIYACASVIHVIFKCFKEIMFYKSYLARNLLYCLFSIPKLENFLIIIISTCSTEFLKSGR